MIRQYAVDDNIPLIGRRAELAFLGRQLRSAARSRGRLVGLYGETGCGKTRLLTEFAQNAKGKKANVVYVKCLHKQQSYPYQPIVEVIRHSLHVLGPEILHKFSALRTLVENQPSRASYNQHYAGLLGQYGEIQLCWEMYQYLQLLAQRTSLVIMFDDFQWADRSTVEFVEFIADGLGEQRIVLIYAYCSNLVEFDSPLQPFTKRIKKVAVHEEMPLTPLNYEESAQMVRALLAVSEDEVLPLTQHLYRHSGGNPLYIRDAIQQNTDQTAATTADHTLSERLAWELKQRLQMLGTEPQRVLMSAVVLGSTFTANELQLLTDIEPKAIEKGLHVLQRCGFITKAKQVYSFTHQYIKDEFYAMLSDVQRSKLHLKIAVLLRDLGEQHMLGRIAYHYKAGGDDYQAVHAFLQAAYDAMRMRAYVDAIEYLLEAQRLVEHEQAEQQLAREIHEKLGDCYFAAGDAESACQKYLVVYRLPTNETNNELIFKIATVLSIQGKYSELLQFVDEAIRTHDLDELWTMKLKLVEARVLASIERYADSMKIIRGCLKVFRRHHDRTGLAYAYMNTGCVFMIQRNLRASRYFYRKALQMVSELDDNQLRAEIYSESGFMAMCREQWDQALVLLDLAADDCLASGYMTQLHEVYFNKGVVYTFIGEWSKANDLFNRAIELNMGIKHHYRTISIYLNLSYIAVHQNKLELVRKYLHRCVKTLKLLSFDRERFAWQIFVSFAGYYFMAGRYDRAVSMYEQMVEPHRELELYDELEHIYLRLTQIYGALGNLDKAFACADEARKCLDSRHTVFARIKSGELDYVMAMMYRLKGDLTMAQQVIDHALETNIATGNRLYQGYCYHELSTLHQMLGNKKLADHYLEQANRFFNQLGIRDLVNKTYYELIKKSYYKLETEADQMFSTVLHYIGDHYKQTITLEELAAQTYLSASRLRHLIKEKTGYTFKDYVIFLRLQEAEALLKDAANNVAEVAAMTGFSNQQYFNRLFKKKYGMTPGQYRKRYSK